MVIRSAQNLFAITFVLGAACAFDADAQSSRTMNSIERRIDTINRQAKDYERDNMSRDGTSKNDPETARRSRQIRVEIEEDLNSLQSTYNNTVVALQGRSELPAGFAAETGKAVRKHASRLKANLALPAPDGKEEKTGPPPLPETDRKALTTLCRFMYEFITNPMFEGTGGLDAKNGAKARVELDSIIRLAEHLSHVPEIATK